MSQNKASSEQATQPKMSTKSTTGVCGKKQRNASDTKRNTRGVKSK